MDQSDIPDNVYKVQGIQDKDIISRDLHQLAELIRINGLLEGGFLIIPDKINNIYHVQANFTVSNSLIEWPSLAEIH